MNKKMPKMHELYVSKKVVLHIPYRVKTREIKYMITGVSGTDLYMEAQLVSMKFPCEIPKMNRIKLSMYNEFPTKPIKKLKGQSQTL